MEFLNTVNIEGNMAADPALSYSPQGHPVVNVNLAINETRKGHTNGDRQDIVTWVQVQVWGKQAEAINKYCKKGFRLIVTGKLRSDSWEDKEGNKKYKVYILANDVLFRSKIESEGSQENAGE